MNSFFIIIASVISLLLASLGFIVLMKNVRNIANQLFFFFSIFFSSWLISSFLENMVASPRLAEIFLRLDFFFGGIAIFFAFAFLFNFPVVSKRFNRFLPVIFLPSFFVSILSSTDLIIKDIALGSNGISFEFGSLFNLYALVLVAGILAGVINQVLSYISIRGVGRMQIKYVLSGFLVLAIATMFNLFFQNSVPLFVYRIANFSPIILFFCIFYAIVRYHLMDIRLVIRLGAVFSFLIAAVTALYASLGYLASGYIGMGRPWNYILPSVIVVISFGKIKDIVESISDRIFFQKKYRFSDLASEIETVIRTAGLNLDKALGGINEAVSSSLKVSAATIFVVSPEFGLMPRHVYGDRKKIKVINISSPIVSYLSQNLDRIIDCEELASDFSNHGNIGPLRDNLVSAMRDNGITLAAPIEFQGKLIGIYAFSNKLSHDYFSQEDFKLVKYVVWQISYAIDNANVYEELKKLDEQKTQFISVVSHQFRTPLTASRFNLELCLDGGLSKKEKETSLQEAYQGVLSISDQLDKLLLVLEIEGNEVSINQSLLDGGQIAIATASKLRLKAEEKGMMLKVSIENDNLSFLGDSDKISKALDILISNSISYGFSGGEIKLSVRAEESGIEKNIVFSVADDGIGVNKENSKNIAKKFFRGKDAVSMSPDGIGLGLFIAKKIVSAHDGKLWFENKKKGSIFYVSVPASAKIQSGKKIVKAPAK